MYFLTTTFWFNSYIFDLTSTLWFFHYFWDFFIIIFSNVYMIWNIYFLVTVYTTLLMFNFSFTLHLFLFTIRILFLYDMFVFLNGELSSIHNENTWKYHVQMKNIMNKKIIGCASVFVEMLSIFTDSKMIFSINFEDFQ